MKWLFAFTVLANSLLFTVKAQPYSERMANTVTKIWPDTFLIAGDAKPKWRYDQGVVLKGIESVWYKTGNGDWFNYIQKCMDLYVEEAGTVKGYKKEEFNIDHINNGKLILLLYKVTGKEKYKKAAELLRSQLLEHPRTKEGGFWHKKIYPYQMWLDGLFMGQPFYAEYAQLFHEDSAFNDITRQFVLMENHSRDPKTGLLYHGWDESKQQKWANQTTGQSPLFWGRALGWYGMALVDALEFYPENHPGRKILIAILNRLAIAVLKVQDPVSGVWYDIVDQKDRPRNYKEASASCMLTYTLAKAFRNGYIDKKYKSSILRAYQGIISEFIKEENGQTNLHGTVSVSGLGGNPYRDGSFEYYMSEPVIVNDAKGVGAFLLCAAEVEKLQQPQSGIGKKVLLDRYFNSEKRKDAVGMSQFWHYTWNERSHPGFALLGEIFKGKGASIAHLDAAPTNANLKGASVYIIVDPDHLKDNPNPNFMNAVYVKHIVDWVKAGGVLLLMANDSANCDLEHFNILANKFGIRFTNKSVNMVKNDEFEMGATWALPSSNLFRNKKLYLKEASVLELSSGAKAVSGKDGNILIAWSSLGKGTVLAVGDPWIYNEYIDGRKSLKGFNNFEAAMELVDFLLKSATK